MHADHVNSKTKAQESERGRGRGASPNESAAALHPSLPLPRSPSFREAVQVSSTLSLCAYYLCVAVYWREVHSTQRWRGCKKGVEGRGEGKKTKRTKSTPFYPFLFRPLCGCGCVWVWTGTTVAGARCGMYVPPSVMCCRRMCCGGSVFAVV